MQIEEGRVLMKGVRIDVMECFNSGYDRCNEARRSGERVGINRRNKSLKVPRR